MKVASMHCLVFASVQHILLFYRIPVIHPRTHFGHTISLSKRLYEIKTDYVHVYLYLEKSKKKNKGFKIRLHKIQMLIGNSGE